MQVSNYVYYITKQIFSFFREEDFLRKVKVTLSMIILYRMLYFIPLPGLNLDLVDQAYTNSLKVPYFLSMFLGNVRDLSILSIGISSYISCSMLFNFLHLASDYFKELKKDSAGRNTINRYIRYATFFHAFILAYFASFYIKSWLPNLVLFPSSYFHITTALFVAVGSMITVWIADQISLRGIGNGSSIIIAINIISSIPDAFLDIISKLNSGVLEYKILLLFCIFLFSLTFIVMYCEKIYREYKVLNVSKKNMPFGMLPNNSLVIKLNPAGIYPSIFLPQMLMLFSFVKNFWDYTKYHWGAWLQQKAFDNGGYGPVALQAIVLLLTSYTFAEMLFNPEEKAAEFKSRTVIPGIRPGDDTKNFLEEKLFIMSLIGGCYLVIVCCLPSILHIHLKNLQLPESIVSLFEIHGASLIIVVGVVNEFIDKIIAGIKYKLTELNLKIMSRKF